MTLSPSLFWDKGTLILVTHIQERQWSHPTNSMFPTGWHIVLSCLYGFKGPWRTCWCPEAWRILWTEEPGGLHSIALQRVRHVWVTHTHTQRLPRLFWIRVCVCVCVRARALSRVQLFTTPRTVVCQTPLSVEFPRQEHGAGCHFLLQEIFLTQWLNPCLLHLLHWKADSSPLHDFRNSSVSQIWPAYILYIYTYIHTYIDIYIYIEVACI